MTLLKRLETIIGTGLVALALSACTSEPVSYRTQQCRTDTNKEFVGKVVKSYGIEDMSFKNDKPAWFIESGYDIMTNDGKIHYLSKMTGHELYVPNSKPFEHEFQVGDVVKVRTTDWIRTLKSGESVLELSDMTFNDFKDYKTRLIQKAENKNYER